MNMNNISILPVAEQNAINALVRAGVDLTTIASIEHCSLELDYCIKVLDNNMNLILYTIARDFSYCMSNQVYTYRKEKQKQAYKSSAYRRAEAFFSV